MIKSWYVHVREETMAPARMVSFMEQHVLDCDVCQQDPDVKAEIAKITEMVLPESKIPKAVRQKASQAAVAEPEAEGNEETDQEGDDSLSDDDEKEEEDLAIDDDESPIPVNDI